MLKAFKKLILIKKLKERKPGHNLKEVIGQSIKNMVMQQILQLLLVHGAAFAAGCQLVASCDLAYSTKDALFATPGVNIGLFCSTPMVAVSRKINRKPMMKMLLTGEPIKANYAKEIGLINDCYSKI